MITPCVFAIAGEAVGFPPVPRDREGDAFHGSYPLERARRGIQKPGAPAVAALRIQLTTGIPYWLRAPT